MTDPSPRAADLRFLLPAPVVTVALHGPVRAWADALQAQGLRVVSGDADLAVGPESERARVEASGRHRLFLDGSRGQVLVPLPRHGDPEVLLPVRGGRRTLAAARAWTGAEGRALLATTAGAAAVGLGVTAGLPRWSVEPAGPGAPWLVAEAVRRGSCPDGPVLLAPGRARSVLVVADRSGRLRRVVKFHRDPAVQGCFDDDERAHALLRAAGPVPQQHAAALRDAFTLHGHRAVVEDVAPGRGFHAVVGSDREQATLGRLGRWLVDVAAATATPVTDVDPLAGERARLADVVDHPAAGPDAAAALAGLPPVPAVLEHGDLWPGNVTVRRRGFTVLDWELARRPGWPLWDLLFASDAATVWAPTARHLPRSERFLRLFRGELPGSAALFAAVRDTVARAGVPAEAVGALATLLWADRAVMEARQPGGPVPDDDEPTVAPFSQGRPGLWAADPALGLGWSCWRG